MPIFINLKRKAAFTLFEILTVLMILTLGMSVTGVKVYDMYTEQQFLSESQQVLSKLQTAQDLMLILDTDVTLNFVKNKTHAYMECYLDIQKPLTKRWADLIEKPLALKFIKLVEWNDQSTHPVKIKFSLGSMSQGLLVLKEEALAKNKRSTRSSSILLNGYPSPIVMNGSAKKQNRQAKISESLYPTDVYEQLYKDKQGNTQ